MSEDKISLIRGTYKLSIDLLARQTADAVYLRRSKEGLDFLGVLCVGQDDDISLFFEVVGFYSLRKEDHHQVLIADTLDGISEGISFFRSYVRTHPFCYLLLPQNNRFSLDEERRHFYLVNLDDCFIDFEDIPLLKSP